jgi:hypothetical protein
VSLAVIDNGKGFDALAVRADGNGGGQFGLFSIRERVELRGGHVEINSGPGVGTWVSIILPIDHSAEAPVKMVTLDKQLNVFGDAIKIVVVDDHKMVRQGLHRVLEESSDFTIVGEAGDGAEAIAMARELKPHVVISDVNLPNVNGIDATRGYRARATLNHRHWLVVRQRRLRDPCHAKLWRGDLYRERTRG